VYIALWVIVAL